MEWSSEAATTLFLYVTTVVGSGEKHQTTCRQCLSGSETSSIISYSSITRPTTSVYVGSKVVSFVPPLSSASEGIGVSLATFGTRLDLGSVNLKHELYMIWDEDS
ncbi:hypothetical protein JHK87_006614 [Glycine soja]|nr:hypothetical protein JHK87_006614 [Glycine soja]